MPSYLTPGVYFEWTDESRKAISPIRTDIAALVGIAERGPLHTPTRVTSWQQFYSLFGSFIPNGYLAYAVKAFFENGGRECYIVRVAAEPAETTTDGPQAGYDQSSCFSTQGFAPGAVVIAAQTRVANTTGVAQPGDGWSSIVDDVSGFPQGALVEVTQSVPTPHTSFRRVRAVDGDSADKRLWWDQPLDGFVLAQPLQFETQLLQPRLLQSVSGNLLVWESPLPEFYDLAQTISFATGAAVATAQSLNMHSQPLLTIRAANAGAWGNDLRVRITRSAGAAARTLALPQTAPRSVVASVTGFFAGSVVRITQATAAPPPNTLTDYRVVKAVDVARRLIEWDAPLVGFDLVAAQAGTRPLTFETQEFGLSVYEGSRLREVFSGLTLWPDPERDAPQRVRSADDERRDFRKYHAEKIVNSASQLIRLSDESWPHTLGQYADALPDAQAANLRNGLLVLQGGRDGIAALRGADFTGRPSVAQPRGLGALEGVDDPAIVAMPDILIKPVPLPRTLPPKPKPVDECQLPRCGVPIQPLPEAEPPEPRLLERAPDFTLDEIEAAQQALVLHCETRRDCIAVLDAPQPEMDFGAIQSWRRRFDSKYAALYYPWLLVYDPLRLNGNIVRAVPPSGAVAGIYARSDFRVGVHKAPANEVLSWAQGVLTDVSDELQGALNPAGINCIRNLPGRGLYLYGARTVSSDPAWRYVNVRRLMMMIEEVIESSLQWSVFEPNNLDLRRTLVTAVSGFLEALWQRGALVGNVAEEAFFVRCDDSNNPPYLADLGQLLMEVGVAPTLPAEFVIVRIGKTRDTLEMTELSASGALA